MRAARLLAVVTGIGFCGLAGWSAYATVLRIERPGNAMQFLLSSLGVLFAIAVWTLIEIAERLPKNSPGQKQDPPNVTT